MFTVIIYSTSFGFCDREQHPAPELPSTSLLPHHEGLSQDVARHCIIQARLLAYRTGLTGFTLVVTLVMTKGDDESQPESG